MAGELKRLAEEAKEALPDMEWTAQMSRLHLTASPQGSTCLNDEVTLALCATGEHVYQVLPYLAAANPAAILDLIRERDEARERAERFEKLDREAAKYVEDVIVMRTGFTGEPPYVGWKGLGLALTEALDRRDAAEAEAARYKRKLMQGEAVLAGWTRIDRIKLAAGEMTAQEARTALAVAKGIAASVRSAIAAEPTALAGGEQGEKP